MPEQTASDLIMKFEVNTGQYVAGEVSSEFPLSDRGMTAGFKRSFMFELTSFTMNTGLGNEDVDAATERQEKAQRQQTKDINEKLRKMAKKLNIQHDDMAERNSVAFSKFLSGDDKARYPVDMRPMEFSRLIDKSSPSMLQYCINRTVFESATLIKRKATGADASGEVFLRFDFTKVLLIDVSWEDDEPIKENVEFVCRAVTINYLPQLPNGKLGAAKTAFWSAAKGYSPVLLK